MLQNFLVSYLSQWVHWTDGSLCDDNIISRAEWMDNAAQCHVPCVHLHASSYSYNRCSEIVGWGWHQAISGLSFNLCYYPGEIFPAGIDHSWENMLAMLSIKNSYELGVSHLDCFSIFHTHGTGGLRQAAVFRCWLHSMVYWSSCLFVSFFFSSGSRKLEWVWIEGQQFL